MTRRGREVETLLLTALAALPLYGTQTVGVMPVLLFHLAMAAIIFRVARGPVDFRCSLLALDRACSA